MGHRALLIYQEPGMTFTTRYSHWGALEAKLMGTEWAEREHAEAMMPERHGKRRVADGFTSLKDVAQTVDFLNHECVYLWMLGEPARAFDTVWWRGGTPRRPGSDIAAHVGLGALVELDDPIEWNNHRLPESGDITAEEFHNTVKEIMWGDRIPEWSPMGGDEIRIPNEYRE